MFHPWHQWPYCLDGEMCILWNHICPLAQKLHTFFYPGRGQMPCFEQRTVLDSSNLNFFLLREVWFLLRWSAGAWPFKWYSDFYPFLPCYSPSPFHISSQLRIFGCRCFFGSGSINGLRYPQHRKVLFDLLVSFHYLQFRNKGIIVGRFHYHLSST